MKIAISTLSGIGYGGTIYFKNLIPALAKVDKTNEYHIFILKDNSLPYVIKQDNFIFHECIPNNSLITRFFWEQFILPAEIKERNIDIIFTAKNISIFFAHCKKIISIRNMDPLCYKNYKNYWKLNMFSFIRRWFTIMSLNDANRIIAVSKRTKNYLENNFPRINKRIERIDVIYNGNPINNRLLNSTTYCNEKQPFLLSASKFVAYANQLNLIKGYALLNRKMINLPPLWLAGGIHDKIYFNKIKKFVAANALTDKIKFLGLLPHEELINLYNKALFFIFPSTLEACPHTLIEAMACGIPIATSNIEPMPEICENAAIYFNPFDKDDIADKIKVLLSDCSLREHLSKTALERCRFFNWEKTAKEMVRVFQEVYHNNPH